VGNPTELLINVEKPVGGLIEIIEITLRPHRDGSVTIDIGGRFRGELWSGSAELTTGQTEGLRRFLCPG
jgi:hypothetical protein